MLKFIKEENNPDFNILAPLIVENWPTEWGIKTASEIIDEYKKTYAIDKDRIYYALCDNLIVGWCRYTDWKIENFLKKAHILDIALLKESRGNGWGKELMYHMLCNCFQEGFDEMWSHTFRSNVISIQLHQRFNFEVKKSFNSSIVWALTKDDFNKMNSSFLIDQKSRH